MQASYPSRVCADGEAEWARQQRHAEAKDAGGRSLSWDLRFP